MSLKFPQFIWMAAGQMQTYLMTDSENWKDFKDRKIIVFPDVNAQAEWEQHIQNRREEGFNVRCSRTLFNICGGRGKADLADFPDLTENFILNEI